MTEAQLIDQLEEWCKSNDLPHTDAMELIMRDDLTDTQRKWVTKFISRWEEIY